MALGLQHLQAQLQPRQGLVLAVIGGELRAVDLEQGRFHPGHRVFLLFHDPKQASRGVLQQLTFLIGHQR